MLAAQECITATGVASAREVFGHVESVRMLVILNPTGKMLTSSGFDAFIPFKYNIL